MPGPPDGGRMGAAAMCLVSVVRQRVPVSVAGEFDPRPPFGIGGFRPLTGATGGWAALWRICWRGGS